VQKSDGIDPEQYRAAHAAWAAKATTTGAPRFQQHRQQPKQPFKAKFVQLPVLWIDCLNTSGAGINAWRVACFLLHEVWRTGHNSVRLSNVALVKWRVDRKGKTKALNELRKAGLVVVEESGHAAPLVTVRYPKG
jgi:hypothetical protein